MSCPLHVSLLTVFPLGLGLSSKMCKFYKIFLPAVFKSCRFYMAELILFIPKNACLHLVIHSKLVAD